MSIKSFSEAALEAIASKERDKIVKIILSAKPDKFWIDIWKKHGKELDWPTTFLGAILQEKKWVPDPIRDFIMNSAEDLLDAIRDMAEGKNNPTTPKETETSTTTLMTLKGQMMKIADSDTLFSLMGAIQKSGKREELLAVSGSEEYINNIIERLIAQKDDENLKKTVQVILGDSKVKPPKFEAEIIIEVSKRKGLNDVLTKMGEKKRECFFSHLKSVGALGEYLDLLESRSADSKSAWQVEVEIERIHKKSINYKVDWAKDFAKKTAREINPVARKFWDWVDSRVFFFLFSVLLSALMTIVGVAWGIPILTGGGILLGIIVMLFSWLSSGILPVLSLIFKKQIYPESIRKIGFWLTTVGLGGMLLRGMIHGPEAIIALALLITLIAFVMWVTKFQSEKIYWIILAAGFLMFLLTYTFPENYSAICRSISKGNKLWIANTDVRANLTDVKAIVREGYVKKNVGTIYDTTFKVVSGASLPKGLGIRYFDFKDEIKTSENGIPFIRIMVPDSVNEYHEDGPQYYIEANLVEVNRGSSALSFLPFGKKDLGVETAVDGNYSVKKDGIDGKEVWKIVSQTDNPFKVEGLPVGKDFSISGDDYEYSPNGNASKWIKIPLCETRQARSSLWLTLAKGRSVEIIFS